MLNGKRLLPGEHPCYKIWTWQLYDHVHCQHRQVNLDYESESDMVDKFRIGLALQPIAVALFANSPFKEGKPTGFLSTRGHVWTDVDASRTGNLPFVFEQGMGFERYVDYAMDVPMYFVYRDGKYVNALGQSWRDFMQVRSQLMQQQKRTMNTALL